MGGALWGGLIGLLFFVPLFGMAIGAATGAAAGTLTDVGVDDNFMKDLGAKLQPGGAAVIVLVHRSTPDKVLPEVAKFGGDIIQTSLDNEAEQRLRHVLETRDAAVRLRLRRVRHAECAACALRRAGHAIRLDRLRGDHAPHRGHVRPGVGARRGVQRPGRHRRRQGRHHPRLHGLGLDSTSSPAW